MQREYMWCIFQVLAKKGGNLGMVDNRGDSAVYWAARQGHHHVVQYLISQGVHVNQQNKVTINHNNLSAQSGTTLKLSSPFLYENFIRLLLMQFIMDAQGLRISFFMFSIAH